MSRSSRWFLIGAVGCSIIVVLSAVIPWLLVADDFYDEDGQIIIFTIPLGFVLGVVGITLLSVIVELRDRTPKGHRARPLPTFVGTLVPFGLLILYAIISIAFFGPE